MTGITANQNILELEEFKYASSIQGIFDFYRPTLVSEMQNEPSIQDHITPPSPERFITWWCQCFRTQTRSLSSFSVTTY